MLFRLSLQLLTAATCILAAPVHIIPRGVINHDAVPSAPQDVGDGIAGELYLKYKPYLEVYNGCVSFPAVDGSGNTGGGLDLKGTSHEGCSSSTGQVYARSATYNGAYAIMYSWYMPKDSPSPGLGHRHDWENIVVWLSSQSSSATLRGIAISAHGKYQKETAPPLADNGTRPKIGYISFWPLNHQLIATDKRGAEQPLIAWERMTSQARLAIETTNFESATPSFRDSNFEGYLKDAFI